MGLQGASKVMTTKEAVGRFVRDGDSVITGNYTEALPMSLIFEIIRQRKKHLTYYSQSGSVDAEFMVAGDCVDRMVSAFLHKFGGRKSGGSVVEKYQREFSPRCVFKNQVGMDLMIEHFRKDRG